MISVNFRHRAADTHARTHFSCLSLSLNRELKSPKLYRCRFLISFEKHFAFQYSPKAAIPRACLVPRRIIHSQRVKPKIVVRVSINRAIFHFFCSVIGFFKTYRKRFKQRETSRIKRSTIKNIIYRCNY